MATLITGLQTSNLSGRGAVMATAKHFIGDGGTTGGADQGNTEISEAELRAIHLPPFEEALRRDVGTARRRARPIRHWDRGVPPRAMKDVVNVNWFRFLR